MKHFKLVLTLVLLGVFLTSPTYAGKGAGTKAPTIATSKEPERQVSSLDPRIEERKARVQRAINDESVLQRATPSKLSREVAAAEPIPDVNPERGVAIAAGTYSIPSATYPTILDAVIDLNTNGITGNVVFELTASDYYEVPATLGGAYLNAGTFSVTIRPDTGVNAAVHTIASTFNGKGLSLTGAKNVHINGHAGDGSGSLTLDYDVASSSFPSGDANAARIYIASASDNISVRNASIEGIANASPWSAVTDARHGIHINGPGNITNVTVDNCTISNAYYGIVSRGGNNGPLTFTNNKVGGAFSEPCAQGIVLVGGNGVTISRNEIKELVYNEGFLFDYSSFDPFIFGFIFPILAQNVNTASKVTYNVIDDYLLDSGPEGFVMYGIRAVGRSGQLPLQANNCITRLRTNGDEFLTIFTVRGQRSLILHESIYLSGTSANGTFAEGILNLGGGIVKNCINYQDIDCGAFGTSQPILPAGGVSDYNVLDAVGPSGHFDIYSHIAATGQDAHSVQGNPHFLSATDLHLDKTAFSAADGVGQKGQVVTLDFDGDARDTSGMVDAGYDETTLDVAFDHDVTPVAVLAPTSAGATVGLPNAVQVVARNNRPVGKAAFSVQVLFIEDDGDTVYNETGTTVALGATGADTLDFPDFTPSDNDAHTMIVRTVQAADQNPDNDELSQTMPIVPLLKVAKTYYTDFNTPAAAAGWVGTGDWVLSSTFTKLTGPLDGSSWVTEGADPESYSEVQANQLLSPYFDLTQVAGETLYVSFYHSIELEPSWDRSIFQYTLDTGRTWRTLGTLNDPNGINWYDESVYQNAAGNPDCFCFQDNCPVPEGLHFGTLPDVVYPAWASNGGPCEVSATDFSTGPYGYIYVQYKIPVALGIAGNPFARFRYMTWADFGSEAGWAFDNFNLTVNPTNFTGSICGVKFDDNDGDGEQGLGEDGIDGLGLNLFYFGVHVDSTTTANGGQFCFNNLVPGEYDVLPAKDAGIATSGETHFSHNGVDNVVVALGNYTGGISGVKFQDTDNDSVKDGGEPGLSGWTIEVHQDSCTGALVTSAVTGAGGAYSIPLLPGTYCVKEVVQAGWKQNVPSGGSYTITVSGKSESETAVYTGKDFGNWQKGTIRVEKFVDLNGNGIKEVGDVTALPSGVNATFTVKKNGNAFATVTVGNGGSSTTLSNLDAGTYTVEETGVPTGWVQTFGLGVHSRVIDQSGEKDTATYMNFKLMSISGSKFDDLDGDGVKDQGEPGLAGEQINLSGPVNTSTTTDSAGNYSFANLPGGAVDYTVTTKKDEGVTVTLGANGYVVVRFGTVGPGNNITGRNFGNFTNICISGTKYRDYNNDSTRQANEPGMPGVTINIGNDSAVTDNDGNWSLCDLGPGSYQVCEKVPQGYNQTEPNGCYTVDATSGQNVSGLVFGNFNKSDQTSLYRTFGNPDLACAIEKPVKRAKPGKPILLPNYANLLSELYGQTGNNPGAVVGLASQPDYYKAGKFKAWLQPAKYKDVFKTLCKKGNKGPEDSFHGFDFSAKGKPMFGVGKAYKSLPPDKYPNTLTKCMLLLAVNIAASDHFKTPQGLGELVFDDKSNPNNPYNGMTVREIKDAGDAIMTSPLFRPLSDFTDLYNAVKAINEAFRPVPNDPAAHAISGTDTVQWINGPKLTLNGVRTVFETSVLKPGSGAAPTIIPSGNPVVSIPDRYELGQNYPNPFNPTTFIEFDLPEDSYVTITIYNMLGQMVGTIVENEFYSAGTDEVEFDASGLSSGVYLYRIVAQAIDEDDNLTGETFTQVKKMVLMK
ncbi:MAG: T9SS type A sorting domain-containing protein [Ignavibacteriae bacterium]|nr:T9SS type A sorting domain-containing protein [Ignavibacteriota bacterium]